LPDLSNVHLVDRGLTLSALAYLVFVCLAAVASIVLAFFVGRVEATKRADLNKLQDHSATIAKSNEFAERSALVEHEQRRLQSELARLQAERDQWKRENLDLCGASDKAGAERSKHELRNAPRHIGTPQRHAIQTAMASFRGQTIAIIIHPGDPEIAAFASQLRDVLEAAGMVASVTAALIFGGTQPGISLEVGIHRRQMATALAKAFTSANICCGPISATESDNADLLEIIVGPKP